MTVPVDTAAEQARAPGAVAAGSPAATAPGEGPATRLVRHTFSSLRHRDYRYLWTSTAFMSAGQWIQQITLGWLMYDLTASAVLLGALNGLRSLPFLICSPIAGVAADRLDRRKLILGGQVVLLATALLIAVVVVSDLLEVWHLFLFTLVTGVAWSFVQTVRQTLVPNVVPREDVMNAVALSSIAFNLNKILGPAVGGLLIAWIGAGGNFFVQAAAYAGVLVMVFLMRVPPTPSQARQSTVVANLKEGLAYVRSNQLVLALIVAALVPQVFALPYQALMPVFQKDVFGVGPEGLGLLMAAPGLGAVLALLVLASVASTFRRKGLLLLGGLTLLGMFLILFSRTTSLPLALLTLVGVGSCQMVFMTTTNSLLHVTVPDALRGRVMSIYLLDHGLMPAGALLAGLTTSLIGAPDTVAMMGSMVIMLALLVGLLMPRLRQLEA